jgi:hypothetical protein
MGLDMYLKAERYLDGWKHHTEAERKLYADCLALVGLTPADVATEGAPSGNIAFNVGYWRKANAIHGWFVTNVQDEIDECQPHNVSREQLKKLREACQLALTSADKAGEVLPTRSGFFFGSTEYDEYYKQDLKDTIVIVDRCLSSAFENWSFEYCSSW